LLGNSQHALAASRTVAGRRALSEQAGGTNTRLILLGTAGGPVWSLASTREGIASALVVNDAVYLIDCGEGVGRQLRRTGLGGPQDTRALERLRGIFITHLHSDHTVDYPNLFLFGLHAGLITAAQPVQVYGPGNRGALPPVFGTPATEPPVINPPNPEPGTVEMTDHLMQAYATDLNDRVRDNLRPDPRTLLEVHDIVLPPGAADDPNGNPSPPLAPFAIYQDENVRVLATLVYHAPMFPSFAFRFDTADGAAVFSGDTGPSDNLIRLARGANVLVHEVIDAAWIERLIGPTPWSPAQEGLFQHLVQAHTTIEDVGRVADAAGVRTLVLTHLIPATNPAERWLEAQAHFGGELVVGEELQPLAVSPR
jgi:ribonuclease BN (tRNA processing enzyme)